MRKIELLAVLVFISTAAFCQKYIVIDTIEMSCYYNYEFQEDSTSKYSMKSQEMVLQVGKKRSLFVSRNREFVDSLLYAYRDEPPQVGFPKISSLKKGTGGTHPYCTYYVYKNYPTDGASVLIDWVDYKYFKVPENNHINWTLVPGADSLIAGFRCSKATTRLGGRNYTAWYTLEIPISEGPYKFNGLPGLIVLISDDHREHRFKLIQITKQKAGTPIFLYDTNFIEVTQQDYNKAKYTRFAELVDMVQQGNMLQMNEEKKAEVLNRLKSRNNLIEKY